MQGIVTMGWAADALYFSVRFCSSPQITSDTKELCSANVHFAAASFTYVGTFFSLAATDCAQNMNIEAQCAADVTNLVGALQVVGYVGSSLTQSCAKVGGAAAEDFRRLSFDNITKQYEAMKRRHAEVTVAPLQDTRVHAAYSQFKELEASLKEKVWRLAEAGDQISPALRGTINDMGRHLGQEDFHGLSSLEEELEEGTTSTQEPLAVLQSQLQQSNDRKVVITNCVYDVSQSILFLMRAGLALNGAIQKCKVPDVNEGDQAGKMKCSVALSGVIGSLSWAGLSMSYAIGQCPVTTDIAALCAGDVSLLVAAVAGISSSGSSLTLTCGKWTHLVELGATGKRLLRRLSELIR